MVDIAKEALDLEEQFQAELDDFLVRFGKMRKRVTELEAENAALRQQIGLPKLTSVFDRRENFNWTDHPEIEYSVCERFLKGDGAAELARYVTEQTHKDISANQVTQRLYNGRPPAKLIKVPRKGPLTWAEIWLIGSIIAKRRNIKGWLQPALDTLGIKDRLKPGAKLPKMNAETIKKFRDLFLT